MLIENPGWDSRVRFGIPDALFIRGEVHMTKAEVRAITLSKLTLSPEVVCYDIGAGTGSVTWKWRWQL
jgi:precorrin-6Y C5,15-methyltransferase (decarboxylating)